MIRIDLPWFANVITAIENLRKVKTGATAAAVLYRLRIAGGQIGVLYDGSLYAPFLKISRQKSLELRDLVNRLVDWCGQNPKGIIDEFQEWELSFNREQFTTVFFAEVTGFPTYLITQKENYDIDKLINSGVGLFPANMLKKVPETFHDAMETGKCLAFELHTACGFHTFRVVEAVARKCWDAVSNNKPRPNPQSLGTIARELEKEKLGDDKVAQALRQLTSLHRNPLAHPEAILQADEAGAIVGLARSVISMMLPQIPDQLPTTTAFTQIADALSAVRE